MSLAFLGSARIYALPGALGSRDKEVSVPAPAQSGSSYTLQAFTMKAQGWCKKQKDWGHWTLSAGNCPVYDLTR